MHQIQPLNSNSARQHGNVLYILIVAVALGAAFIFWKESSRSAAKAEGQRLEMVRQKEQQDARNTLNQVLRKFDDVVARWEDADRVAGSAARIAMTQPVGVLQALHREAEQLQAPPCLESGKENLIDAMRETVDGYIAFMQNTLKLGDQFAQQHFAKATPRFAKYKEERTACLEP
jgi:hypothetical protein